MPDTINVSAIVNIRCISSIPTVRKQLYQAKYVILQNFTAMMIAWGDHRYTIARCHQ
jgi:hypothetical protein